MSLLLLNDPYHSASIEALRIWLGKRGKQPCVGYLASTADPTREYFAPVVELYDSLGADITAFAEPIHGPECERYDPLFECDIIHLCGGSAFEYLHNLENSGLIPRLQAFAKAGGHMVGVGAGAMLMTPDVANAAYIGHQSVVPSQTSTALGLVPFNLLVQVHDKTTMADKLKLTQPQSELYLLDKGDAISIDNGVVSVSGSAQHCF